MSDNMLQREFRERDVQRMRNIITKDYSAKTGTQVGYTKKSQNHSEGDIWEENGKQWTIKNGIKQTITKHDKLRQLVTMPLACPVCHNSIKGNDLNKKMWNIHKMCFDCVIEMEAKIKREGKWDEYEKQMMNANKNSMIDDFEASVEEFLKMQNESYFTEQGDIESWGGGKINEEEIKNVKEYIL